MDELTRIVTEYREGSDLQPILDSICDIVYHYPRGKAGFSEDDCAGFLLRFYPRIKNLVSRYRPQGKSFHAYLATTLRYQLRSYAKEKGNEKIRLTTQSEHAVAEAIMPFGRTSLDSDHAASPAPVAIRPMKVSPTTCRRLLFLTLRASERLTQESCRRIAALTGCDEAWLTDRWQELRALYERRRIRRLDAERIRDRAWFRIRCAETRLRSAVDEDEREACRAECARWQVRLDRARDAIQRIPMGPTHKEIATVLGLPKGTVDSGVYKLRQELRVPEYRHRLASLITDSYSPNHEDHPGNKQPAQAAGARSHP